ncbi:Asparagine synthetase (glutamine-hydrolyzing) [Methanosarcina lacustris Z-7289]|uniref:Putative asparagine synthetase [glutamine-hydrolyzing] n=1 Tax=Methanosarcina lacustris Z-7289 TaxID=1434111 RepID=A0A0E3WS45_9EURY|nr:asparagine synthetase B family protein [Methanosarcina lacustris]AKB76260.1 Asparagine synthetase (glutamine-hydrolyzing) [Methanosarcina lacustris Z-7289]
MPGLTGIIKEQGNTPDIEQLLPKMCEIIKYEDWYKTDTFLDKTIGMGRVSLGILNPETQPIFNENKNLCIMMEGEIYDYRDLKEDLISKGHTFLVNNDPEFILHFYEEYKSDFAEKVKELNGIFLFAIYDCNSHELIICNDRYGLKPLYLCKRDNYLLFSSEIKAILQDQSIKREVNLEAMTEFFSFGYVLGDKTLMEGIKLLPPASVFTYSNAKSEIKKYWSWNEIKKIDVINEEKIVDELGRLWLQAVERRMQGNGKIGAFLSGGLDSRAIVSAIDSKYLPIHTLTFGKKDCDDYTIAKRVSETLKTKHHFVEITAERWFSGIEKTVWITEGFLNVIHQHTWDAVDRMKENSDINLNGFAGDLVVGGSYLSKDFVNIKNIEDYLNNVFLKMNKGYIGSTCGKEIYNSHMSEILCTSSRNSIEKWIKQEIKTSQDSDYFFLNNRVRRFTIMGTVSAQTKLENRKPFYDNDFIEFVYSLPNELRSNSYIYNKMLIKFFPATFKFIPWQKTGMPISAPKNIAKGYRLYRGCKSLTNSLLRKISLSPMFKDNTNYVDYNNWMRNNKELRKYIYDTLLSEKSMNRGYFNSEFLKKLIDDHMKGKKSHAQIIGLFLTFELFNRMFIDGEKL